MSPLWVLQGSEDPRDRVGRETKLQEGVRALKIALDAMGGDRAPGVIVDGAFAATKELPQEVGIVLVGITEAIQAEIKARGISEDRLEIVHASESVGMEEQPSQALRKKKDSSIAVGLRLLRDGKVDGFISAGNTGAVVANALFILGRISGVKRPAIATYIPTQAGGCILLDVGANIDCRPEHLLQYGIMGACYASEVLGRNNPRVGLLNVGEESSKGTQAVRDAYKLMAASDLNFVGNLEGRDIFTGSVDVAVCDGFVGNVLLKFAESVISMVYAVMRDALKSSLRGRFGGLVLKPAFRELKSRFDYAEYGSAPLLGVDGVCTIAHGSSSGRAIKNAILSTHNYINHDIRDAIRERLAKYEARSSQKA